MIEKFVGTSEKSDSSKPPEEEEIGIRNLKLLYRNPPRPERDKSSGASSDEETTSSSLVPIPDTLRQMRCELKRTISDIGEHSEIESSSFTARNPAEDSNEKVRSSFDELRKIYTLKNEASVAIKMNSANLMLDDILNSSSNLNLPSNDNRNSRFYKEQEIKVKSETETVTTESSSSSVNNCSHVQLPPLVAHTVPPIAFGFPQPSCGSYCNSFQPVCTCSSSMEKGVSGQEEAEIPQKKSFLGKLQNLQLKHKIMCMYKMMQKSPFVKEKDFEHQVEDRSFCEAHSGNDESRLCSCESKDKQYPKRMIFDLVESSDASQSDHISCNHKREKLKKNCTCPVELKYGSVNQKRSSYIHPKNIHDMKAPDGIFLTPQNPSCVNLEECTCIHLPQSNFPDLQDSNNRKRKRWTIVKRKENIGLLKNECSCLNQPEISSSSQLECPCFNRKESSGLNITECSCENQNESSGTTTKECICVCQKESSGLFEKECSCPEVIPQCICYECTCRARETKATSVSSLRKSSELKSLLRSDQYVQGESKSPTHSPQTKNEEVNDKSEKAVVGSETHSEKKVVEAETVSKVSGGWKKKCTQKRQIFEKTDIYYFDHGNSAYYRTTDHHPTRYTECLVEKTDEYATKFWAEIFGVIAIGLSFIISFVIQFCRFILTSIIRSLTVGLLQIFSDYFFKPLLTIIFNGLIQPCLILIYNMVTSVRDLCLPISQIFGFFTKEIALVLRAFRVVEVGNDSCKKPISNCENKV